jgi:hypothetical protein
MYSPHVLGYPIFEQTMPKNNNSTKKAPVQKGQKVTKKINKPRKDRLVGPTRTIMYMNDNSADIAPVAVSNEQRFPLKAIGARRSHRFTNSELVANVNGSTAFTAIRFPVNPGLPGSFPWLFQEAQRWEQYRFHNLVFRYITRTSTGTVGSIILSPDYNVRDPPPLLEVQATDTQDAVEDSCWKQICCRLDPSAMFPVGPRKFIRPGNVAGDTNLYDAANFYMCSTGMINADAVGKLWVDYDIEFFVPQNSPLESTAPLALSVYGKTAAQAFASTVLTTVLWDPLTFDPLSIGNPVTGVFTPLAGTYWIYAEVTFSDSAAETFSASFELLKNGASFVPRANADWIVTNPAGGTISGSVSGVASFNGVDTFSIVALLAGAAGTLTMTPTSGYLTFRSA